MRKVGPQTAAETGEELSQAQPRVRGAQGAALGAHGGAGKDRERLLPRGVGITHHAVPRETLAPRWGSDGATGTRPGAAPSMYPLCPGRRTSRALSSRSPQVRRPAALRTRPVGLTRSSFRHVDQRRGLVVPSAEPPPPCFISDLLGIFHPQSSSTSVGLFNKASERLWAGTGCTGGGPPSGLGPAVSSHLGVTGLS